jgi:cation diffusion facilitator CzcD-associated flavoprotein CzcO
MIRLPSVCVIGAGSSGIAAAKALHQRGFDFDCFEKSDRVGGNWVFKNRNGMSAAYRSLHINTSRERMEFADFPMPKSFPDFPHHTHIAEYFDAYVDHFGFRERITFETGVEHAAPAADGTWEVTLDDGEVRRYDALIVANGHHWDPRWPEPGFPGTDDFAGLQLHAHDYTGEDPNFFRDTRVVVLGMGNSAMDIAVEASFSATATYLAARRGAWVIPKYVFGRPLDQISTQAGVPFRIRQRFMQTLLRIAVGDMQRYGLPKPDHRPLEAHPTVSDDILSRVAHGEVTPKPNIERLTERTVVFADGSEVEADIVIYCTGYKVSFPFFDPALISAPDNDLPLFRRVFHPDRRGAYFIGLLQPLGAIMPLAAAQSEWVCDHLTGRYALPAPEDMRADIEAERGRMFKRYVASKRHTMQVDFDDYLADLEKERRRGAERARALGFALPVPPRARPEVAPA